MTLDPIVHEYELACSAQHAFRVYTERMGEWWHPDYTGNPETYRTFTIEPRLNGQVTEWHRDGSEIVWGEVRAWEPGVRLAHTWTHSQTRMSPTVIRVTFQPTGEHTCQMTFEHGGWNEINEPDREKFADWPVLLDRFRDLANAG